MEDIFDLNNLRKTYFKMAIPVVLGMVVSLVYNLADTFFIAKTGDMALIAGVSLCSPLFTLLMAFGNIYGQGGSSIISRMLGDNDVKGSKRISSFCFYIAIITGVVIGTILVVFANPILTLVGAKSDTIGHALDYYLVLAYASPIVVLSFIHSNLVRCEGKANISMIGSVSGTIINIILDPIFILVLNMGAKGAAIATVIGYAFSCIFLFAYVKTKSNCLSIKLNDLKVSGFEVKQIMLIGFSAAITNIAQSICVVVSNKLLLEYGTNTIAAMGIVSRINMIAQLIIVGFSFGGVPIFGYIYGRKDYDKLKELIRFVLTFLCTLSIAISAVLILLSSPILNIFVDEIDVIRQGTLMLRLQVAGTAFGAVVLLFTVLFQASGKAIPAYVLALSRQGVVFIVVIYFLNKLFGYYGLISSQFIADIISALIAYMLYKKTFKNEF